MAAFAAGRGKWGPAVPPNRRPLAPPEAPAALACPRAALRRSLHAAAAMAAAAKIHWQARHSS
ncbi:MAG: hypothetical protein GEU89_07475 [Kiloniellaceae bacterium]|nr:hypothetical protein [Kiloniellaceae bacterium]